MPRARAPPSVADLEDLCGGHGGRSLGGLVDERGEAHLGEAVEAVVAR